MGAVDCLSPIGSGSGFAPAVALPLDELTDVASHLTEKKPHWKIGERKSHRECDGESESESEQCEKCHGCLTPL
jgi:hypothetical protein